MDISQVAVDANYLSVKNLVLVGFANIEIVRSSPDALIFPNDKLVCIRWNC